MAKSERSYSTAHYSIGVISGSFLVRSGSGRVIFVLIAQCFAIFKNVVHSLKPVETSSNSASYQDTN